MRVAAVNFMYLPHRGLQPQWSWHSWASLSDCHSKCLVYGGTLVPEHACSLSVNKRVRNPCHDRWRVHVSAGEQPKLQEFSPFEVSHWLCLAAEWFVQYHNGLRIWASYLELVRDWVHVCAYHRKKGFLLLTLDLKETCLCRGQMGSCHFESVYLKHHEHTTYVIII